jgi:hypothetical protein
MEVRLRRQPAGCIYWPLTIMTLGVFPLLVSLGERHFIRTMDGAGVVTRGGRTIAWNEFTSIVQWQGKMKGSVLSDEYILKSSRGKASLPTWRAENAAEAKAFLLQHLPPALLQKSG